MWSKLLPTHRGEHSHFNRLPLPMGRVHLKGYAHHTSSYTLPPAHRPGCGMSSKDDAMLPPTKMPDDEAVGLEPPHQLLGASPSFRDHPHAATAATPLHAAGSCHASCFSFAPHLPVTCPVPPTACHMPCDPIPGSFFNAWRWAHNLCDPNFYPPTEASTATSTDCLYLCDACTLRAMHITHHLTQF